jgi:peptide/nickel transport system permease protein
MLDSTNGESDITTSVLSSVRNHERLRAIARIVGNAVPTTLGVIVLNFVLMQLMPGDAADVLAGEAGSATEETMIQLRHHLGLDRSTFEQFLAYLHSLAHLSLGISPRFNTPVSELIFSRLPDTLLLMLSGLTIALLVGIAMGAVMASWFNRWPDRALSLLSLLFYSMPGFWVALVAVIIFSVHLGWLPSEGATTLGADLTGWSDVLDRIRHVTLPALTLSTFFIAIYARLMRAAMLEVHRQDFVRTAEAKGIHPFFVTLRHVMRNALIPVTTVAGTHFGNLLGLAVVTETVFSWPGIGSLTLDALRGRDNVLLLGILLLSSLLVVLANVLADLTHVWLDPRIEVVRR